MPKILKINGKVITDKEEGFVDWNGTGKTYYYCHYRDVATGKYNCPYAEVVDNSLVCTAECVYNAQGVKISKVKFTEMKDNDYPF